MQAAYYEANGSAREVMRVALLKDPEVLKRIQSPLPAPVEIAAAPGKAAG